MSLLSYNSTPYYPDRDGYVVAVAATSGATGYIRINSIAVIGIPINQNTDLKSVFVRKGAPITVTGSLSSADFYSLENS